MGHAGIEMMCTGERLLRYRHQRIERRKRGSKENALRVPRFDQTRKGWMCLEEFWSANWVDR